MRLIDVATNRIQMHMAVQQSIGAAPVITGASRQKAENNLRKAKVQLVLHQPFFASIVLKRSISLKDDVPTAYVTPAGKIVLGTAFTAAMTLQETIFVLAHETMHYAMMHMARRGWRKHRPWNVACDYVINDLLKKAGVGTPPKEGLFMDGAADHAAEELYRDDPDDGGDGGDGPYTPGNGNDDMSEEGGTDMTVEEMEEIKRELIQARQAAKSQGKMPAVIEALIEDIVNPTTPWHQLLERFMLYLIKAGTSFRRPSKRFVAHDLYMPSQDKKPAMGTVVIQMDESGSIDSRMLEHFSGHINKIIEQCSPERVVVLHTDSAVGKVEEFQPDDFPIQFKSYCGGGTDMCAGIKWCEEEGVEPDVFVTLTDGYTPWPDEAPAFPTVWLITSKDIESPVGESIYYEVTE